jgi:hypothetical protein
MRLGDLYLNHPRIAFALQTVTAAALGYMTHRIQLLWHRENYLLLHVSLWWVLIVLVLLYLAETPLTRRLANTASLGEEWSRRFRLADC